MQVGDLEARLCHAEAKLARCVAESQAESQAQLVALQLARADQAAIQELYQHEEMQQAQLLTQLQTCQVGSLYALCMPAEAMCFLWLFMLSRKREQVLLQGVAGSRSFPDGHAASWMPCMYPASREAQCTLLCLL